MNMPSHERLRFERKPARDDSRVLRVRVRDAAGVQEVWGVIGALEETSFVIITGPGTSDPSKPTSYYNSSSAEMFAYDDVLEAQVGIFIWP
jgi:hypothetical protein